jgi:hypothetical protein
MKKQIVLLLPLLFLSFHASAQNSSGSLIAKLPENHMKKTDSDIKIDGVLDEPGWQAADPTSNFWQYFPTDSLQATGPTEISMTYDEQFLYVAVKCYTNGNNYVIPSMRRDFDFFGNDNLSLLFDTFNDKNNAFVFGINPYGVRREFYVSNGGRQPGDGNDSWDNKWFGESKIYDNYWIAEIAIPFNTLRFNEGSTKWRFNCYRNDTQINEISTWVRIPQNYIIMDLTFMGDMIWEEPLTTSGSNISLIPYLTAGVSRDFEDPTQEQSDWTRNIGGDAKIAITSGLNLDLTLNPDFSQVEVDQQVTNISRFEILLPERRQFFLENADLFSEFGLGPVNAFFTRRIGIAIDTSTGQNIQNSILYGARLSGKLNDDLRVGLLNMTTARQKDAGLPAFNYTVATAQQQVFNRSNVAFLMVNKQAINPEENNGGVYNNYNRVMGLEYRLFSPDNRWTGKTFYHRVFTPYERDHKFAHGFQLEYLRRHIRLEWAHLATGFGYDAEVGFVPRKDYFLISPEIQLFFYPKKGIINQHDINLDNRIYFELSKDPENLVTDPFEMSERQHEITWSFQFRNNTRGSIQFVDNELTLLRDFDPTRLQDEGVFLPAGNTYKFRTIEARYTSDQRKAFFIEVAPSGGSFFNGSRLSLSTDLTYRIQPYGSIGLSVDYNRIKLAEPFVPVDIWLVGPRFDVTLSKTIFFTTFIQYNNQLDNVNINSRFQWRFQPVSDFFLVYTDNYLVDPFSQWTGRNRSLVAKVTYWLNL